MTLVLLVLAVAGGGIYSEIEHTRHVEIYGYTTLDGVREPLAYTELIYDDANCYDRKPGDIVDVATSLRPDPEFQVQAGEANWEYQDVYPELDDLRFCTAHDGKAIDLAGSRSFELGDLKAEVEENGEVRFNTRGYDIVITEVDFHDP